MRVPVQPDVQAVRPLYPERLVREQIDRVALLKDTIPDRLRHEALVRLAALCEDALDDQAQQLGRAGSLLDSAGDAGVAGALDVVKRCTRAMRVIEGYGIPALHCQSDQAVFLNDVLSAMHGEVGLPFPCPAVACTSNDYYFTHLSTGTIHVPLSEAGFLLHLPDFYHELGHMLHESLDQSAQFEPIRDGVAGAIGAVDRHYQRLVGGTDRGAMPAPAPEVTAWIRAQWTYQWMVESFCDLFALFAAGPAYAYSHLHLVSKTDAEMYRLDLLMRQDHPADEARMRMLDSGMRLFGYAEEAAHVRREWDTVARHCGPPRPEYGLVFPSGLLESIASSILLTFGRAGLRGHPPGVGRDPASAGAIPVAGILNDGWRAFWRSGDVGFREQEKALIAKLAAVAREGTAAR